MPFPAAASAHSLATAVGQSPFGGAPYLESFHPPFGGALPGGYMPLGISAEGTEAPPQDPGLMGGPSPADSTSVYWAYTPAVQAADRAAAAAAAQQGQSENAASSTKRRRPSEAPTEAGSVRGENETGLQSPASVADLQLPPPEARTETLEGGGAEPVLYKTAGQQGQPPAPANGNGNAPNNGAAQASNPQMAAESAPTSTSFPRRQSVVQGGGASDPNSGAATAPATASNGTAPPASDPTARKE